MMTTHIAIDIDHGGSFVTEGERYRALVAAEDYLQRAGTTAEAASAAYQAQWEEFDDEAPMHGAARIWIEARNAADCALTAGWVEKDGASCSIRAWTL